MKKCQNCGEESKEGEYVEILIPKEDIRESKREGIQILENPPKELNLSLMFVCPECYKELKEE